MPEVQLIARHTMKSGTEDEVLSLVEELVAASRAEPGNLAFKVYRGMSNSERYVLLERYASREALAAHRTSSHFRRIVVRQLIPLLADRVVEEFDAPTGETG